MFHVALNFSQHKGKVIYFSEVLKFKRSKLNQGHSEGVLFTVILVLNILGLHIKNLVGKERWQTNWCRGWEPGIRSQEVGVLALVWKGTANLGQGLKPFSPGALSWKGNWRRWIPISLETLNFKC